MEIAKSDIVLALCGRESGRLYFVLELDGNFALIADGKRRKIENPKRKNLKHIQLAARTDSRVAEKLRSGEKVLNSELRRELAVTCLKFQSHNQGG